MMAILARRATVSITLLTPVPSGARASASPCEANGHHDCRRGSCRC